MERVEQSGLFVPIGILIWLVTVNGVNNRGQDIGVISDRELFVDVISKLLTRFNLFCHFTNKTL